jgi:hypothetical protein
MYRGVPVFAAILQAHLSADNELTGMNGVFVPDIDVNTNPSFNADEAAQRAIANVLANPPDNEDRSCSTFRQENCRPPPHCMSTGMD